MKVFTIGYGGRTKEEFLALLRDNGVRTVADVRLRPDKAYMGIWVRAKAADKGIENWLAKEGIGYRSFIELGNVFIEDPQDWARRYEALLRTSGDILTERLRAAPGPVCLLCAERHVVDCHRFLVARYLADRHGAEIEHLE